MTLLEMSLEGGVLIAVILVLRRALLHRVPKWTFLLLWAAALCRLLIPFSVPSPVSVHTGTAWVAQTLQGEAPEPAEAQIPLTTAPGTIPQDGPVLPAAPAVPEPERASPLAAVWPAGTLLCGLFFAAAYLQNLRRFHGALPAEDPFIRRWQKEHPAVLPIRVKTCRGVSAPLAYGLLRPVILLPAHTDWSDGDHLTYILTHEYIHIRRGDLLWKLLLTAALCIHWCNPLVWAMYFCANRDLELACDEAVVRTLGLDSRRRYAHALLSAAESGFFPLCTTYTTKNHMEERIRAIMNMKKQSAAAVLAALVLTAGVTAVFATSRAPAEADSLPCAVQSDPPPKSVPSAPQKPAPPPLPEEDKTGSAGRVTAENWDYDIIQEGDAAAGRVDPLQPPAQNAPENRWGVPDGEIPQWTEFTVADFDDARELGKYLETVHGLYPGDYTPGWMGDGSYIVQVTYMERAVRQRLPDGRYPVNSKGETYGAGSDCIVVGYRPDLELVQATNGKSGYALRDDLMYGGYPGEINNPSDAMAYMEWLETQPDLILVPVYDVNRDNIVGYYGVSNSSGIITQEEELSMVEDQLRRHMDLSEDEITRELEKLKETKGWS